MQLPSILEAPLPAHAPTLGISAVIRRLEEADLPISRLEPAPPDDPELEWALDLTYADEDTELQLQVYKTHTDRELVSSHVELGSLPEDQAQALLACSSSLGLRTMLDPVHPLRAFHIQLRILALIAPEAAGLVDQSAYTAHPMGWLEEAASSPVPPHPHSLWTIHAVWEDEGTWLHTHGLHRCGVIELDMVDIPRDQAANMAQLLNTAATLMLDHGVPEPDEPFEVGQDMPLVWLDVDTALDKLGRVRHGGPDERDPLHHPHRGVLAVKEKGLLWGHNHRSPTRYAEQMEGHPLLYVSDLETARRTALAIHRFDRMLALWRAHQESPALRFLVKLAIPTQAHGREHIWFDLHGLGERGLDLSCLNQPHDVPWLREGDRGWHDTELLSDWMILCPLGQIGPDAIARIEALVADAADLRELEAMFED